MDLWKGAFLGLAPFQFTMKEECTLCIQPESSRFVPNEGTGYVCSSCFLRLLKTHQEELKRGHNIAIERGYTYKAKVLETFIEEIMDRMTRKQISISI